MRRDGIDSTRSQRNKRNTKERGNRLGATRTPPHSSQRRHYTHLDSLTSPTSPRASRLPTSFVQSATEKFVLSHF